jgi:hypothetical protein
MGKATVLALFVCCCCLTRRLSPPLSPHMHEVADLIKPRHLAGGDRHDEAVDLLQRGGDNSSSSGRS